jgi:hypothetical protein
MEPGPLVSCSGRLNGPRASRQRMRVTTRVVTRQWPYTTGHHRPMWAQPYPVARGCSGEALFHSRPHARSHPLLPLSAMLLLGSSPLYSPWPAMTKPPPCRPTRPKGAPWRRARPAPSASRVTTYQSRAVEVSMSLTTSVRSSSSTAGVWAPLASPPLQEGPLKSVVGPRLHHRRRWPPVWAEAAVIIPRLPSTSSQQPSPTVLRPCRSRQ